MDLLIYIYQTKYKDDNLAKQYSNINNYFEIATRNIEEMYNQVGNPKFDEKGMLKKGVIVRVLLLPDHLKDAKELIRYLYEKYKNNIYISIMNQYTPVEKIDNFENLNRKVTEQEYDELINYACDIGVTNAFIQEGDTQEESFIPIFDETGV